MAGEYGFVYFLSNDSMPGIYKVGFTLSHPKARMDQLSGATACPTPFRMLACFGTSNPREVEAEIHEYLSHCRVNTSREFFEVPLSTLSYLLTEHGDREFDLVNSTALDRELIDEKERAAKQWPVDYFFSQCADPIHWPKPQRGGFC